MSTIVGALAILGGTSVLIMVGFFGLVLLDILKTRAFRRRMARTIFKVDQKPVTPNTYAKNHPLLYLRFSPTAPGQIPKVAVVDRNRIPRDQYGHVLN